MVPSSAQAELRSGNRWLFHDDVCTNGTELRVWFEADHRYGRR